MRKVLIIALFLLFAPFAARAQTAQGYLTASGTTCATAGACVTLNIPSQAATGTFTISGTWSATLQFEISQDGTNFAAVNAFPPNSSTGASSATANGTWTVSIAGMRTFRVRCSAFTSGSALVTINTSNAVSAAAMSAGGGGGTVTAVTGTSPVASSGGTTPAISCPTCFFGGPNTSGTIPVANGTQSLTDAVGVTYSYPGSVPTLTFTDGSGGTMVVNTSHLQMTSAGDTALFTFQNSTGPFASAGTQTANLGFVAAGDNLGDTANLSVDRSARQSILSLTFNGAAPQMTMTVGNGVANLMSEETAAPSNPASGNDLLYFDSTSHNLTCLRSTGASCLPAGTTGALPVFASYTISAASGTYSALNNTTGVVDATGTDAGALIQTAISNMSSAGTCGTIYLKTPPSSAVYNINTLSTESTGGFTNTYAIGIPGAVSSGQYCQWTIQGEGAPATVNQFDSTGVQATGTTLYITPTAVTSAGASTVEIAGIWARPDTVNGAGATVILKNIEVRFPTNQRGCETGIDLTQALNTFRDNVTTDFNIAPGSLAYPVAGAGCTGGITANLVGQTTTASSKEENTISNSYSVGYNINWDIQSEHTVMFNIFGINGNHCVDYGVRGGTLSAPSSWMNVGCIWQTVGLTLGANMAAGSLLDISGMTFEDENGGTFPTTTHAIETNAGNTRGRISYSRSLSGTGNTTLANMFDGGGGTAFAFQGNGVTNNFTTRTIANGTATLGTGAISSGACASVVTVAGTGIATTDDIIADFNADPTSTTGYQATSAGMLTIIKYPTSGDVNFKVCNNTGGSITPGAVTLNWRVVR